MGILASLSVAVSLAGHAPMVDHVAALAAPLVLAALAAEVLPSLFGGGREVKVPLRWTEPADGEIGLAEVADVSSAESIELGEFRQFESLRIERPPIGVQPRHPTPPLLGRVAIVTVLVGRDGRSWQPAEIRSTLNEVTRAARWIALQAKHRAVPLRLELGRVFFVADDPMPGGSQEFSFGYQGDELVPGGPGLVVEELGSFSRASAQLGFADAAEMVEVIGQRIDADAIAWILSPMRSGLSFAIRASDDHLQGVGLAVCYPRLSSFSSRLRGPVASDPATIAHEVLHLFGAEDKYGRPLGGKDGRGVTSRDVMRLDSPRLSRLRIDDLTAAEIGWNAR